MRSQLLALMGSLLLTAPALAGVVVKINGIEFKPGVTPPVTPPLGVTVAFSGSGTLDTTITFPSQISTTVLIHIFDEATDDNLLPGQSGYTAPAAGIGRLTLVGSAGATGRINLLIADGDQTAFPLDGNVLALAAIQAGLTTFGGSSIGELGVDFGQRAHDYDAFPWSSVNSVGSSAYADTDPNQPGLQLDDRLRGIIIPDPSLRRQTVLAAVVSQDICPGYVPEQFVDEQRRNIAGRIEVGQVLRLAAIGQVQADGSVVNGNINGGVAPTLNRL